MAQKKKPIFVEKRNILNELIAWKFSLCELRLFSIYLGRINARDIRTRVVRLGINQFYRVMGLHLQKDKYLKKITDGLLMKIVYIPDEKRSGDYTTFQLFKECKIAHDGNGDRYFEIDANDRALDLLFNYKRDYFTYELWNVLNLESVNQVRMYELLKQYEKRGERVISLADLKALLGIGEDEYPRWDNFRLRVLNACQKAIKEKTDICFTCEPYTKSGRGGKIQSLRFTITKNADYKCQLNLDEFLGVGAMERIKRESAEQEPEPDVSGLDFIQEPLSEKDKLTILEDAEGSVEIVKKVYELAKQQKHIESFVGFMRGMIKKYMNGEISGPIPVNRQKQNNFVNFPQRNIDFAALEGEGKAGNIDTEGLPIAT